MPKKKKGFLNWLFDHGVGTAYMFLVTTSVAITLSVAIGISLLIDWWDRVR